MRPSTEATLIYNVVDDNYYIYIGEDYYRDTNDKEKAIEYFKQAVNELKSRKQPKQG